jgi:glycosyltransferase involved in cell wall biosynthesis
MRIGLYIHDILFRTGGTESYTSNLVYALQSIYNCPKITIISEYYTQENRPNVETLINRLNCCFGTKIENKNLDLVLIKSNRKIIFNVFYFYLKMQITSFGIDIFFNCSLNMYTFNAKKNIIIIHFPPYKKIYSSPAKSFPFYIFARYRDILFAKGYDLYMPNSIYTKKWLNKIWNISDNKVDLLYPPVMPISSIHKHHKQKENSIIICSRIEPSKEIDILISAFLSSVDLKKEAHVYILGAVLDDDIDYVKMIKIMISDFSNHITLIGNPPRNEIEQYYSRCKIFWHVKGYSYNENEDPYALEHFGITSVEAMSAGCVPVVINKGGQKEIVEHGINGFCWNTPEQLINYTIFLLKNPDKYDLMSKAAQKRAEYFSISSFTQKLNHILNSHLY